MFFCQFSNNIEIDGQMNFVQNIALLLKIIFFFVIIAEVPMLVYESYKIRYMHGLNFKGYAKLDEDQRRKQYSRKMLIISLAAIVIFMAIFLLGMVLNQGRACGSR